MEKKIEELRKKIILEVSSWGGLGPNPGHSGSFITSDKVLYHYHEYYYLSKILIDNNVPQKYLSKGYQLNDSEYEQVISFIEKEIIDKTFEPIHIFDAGFTVSGNYQNRNFNIVNQINFDNKEGLYDKAIKLFNDLEGKSK